MKLIKPGLFPVWNEMLERYQIFWKDPVSRITRYLMTIEGSNGEFRPIDTRALIYLSQNIAWDMLHEYPEPMETYKALKSEKSARKQIARNKAEDKRKYSIKHDRREWKAALENAKSGIFNDPVKPVEKKIVSYPGWAKKYQNSKETIVIAER